MMEDAIISNRINEIITAIFEAQNAYYIKNEQIMSDAEYDELVLELKNLESKYPHLKLNDSPTNSIGGSVEEKFKKIKHPAQVLSLSNAFSVDDVFTWYSRNRKEEENITKTEFVVEPKLDGLTVVLHYVNGKLKTASTRGDGEIGEVITENVKTVKSVPFSIPCLNEIYVRGEAIVHRSDFEKFNDDRAENGLKTYQNPRNAVSGGLRNLDPKVTASMPIKVYLYQILSGKNLELNQIDKLEFLRQQGFLVFDQNKIYKNIQDIVSDFDEWKKIKDTLPFDTDGIVVKVNNWSVFENLGVSGKDPRGAIAFKWPAEEKRTRLLDVKWPMGRTGNITPLAILEPVEIGGVIVKQATLHNFDYINKRDIRIGDMIYVKRAGEVIPYISATDITARNGTEKVVVLPEFCSSCGTKIIANESGIINYCPSQNCSEKKLRFLQYFVSKESMDVIGLGEKVVEQFFLAGLVKNPSDFWKLTANDLEKLDGFGDRKVELILDTIQKAKDRSLGDLIASLGIDGVGNKTAMLLAAKYKTIDNFLSLASDTNSLKDLENVGEKTIDSLVQWISNSNNGDEMKKFNKILTPDTHQTTVTKNVLNGKVFVITGTLSHPRSYFQKLIDENGGVFSESLGKSTNFLLMGEKAGSKEDKAKKLGTKILSENEFLEMLK